MIKRYVLTPASVFLLFVNLFAQERTSPQAPEGNDRHDTTEVRLLVKRAFSVVNASPDSAFMLAQRGYALAQHVGFRRGEADCLNLVGTAYLKTGNYPQALDCRFRTLKIYESMNSVTDLIIINSNIGNIFSEAGNDGDALAYYYRSLELARRHKLADFMPMVLCNIGDQYEKMNMLDSARVYSHAAYELASGLKQKEGQGIVLCNLGNIHLKMGEDQLAKGYYELSLPDFVATNNREGICEATMGLARLFRKSGQRDSAVYYGRLSFETAARHGFTKPVLNASSFLSDVYRDAGRFDSAYYFLSRASMAKDSLFSQERNERLQNLVYSERIRQQELTLAAQQAEKERKDNVQLTAIAAFIPAFFSFVLFLRKRKTNRKAIEFLGLLGLLFLFEFITLFIHPTIEKWTHHTPLLMLLILVAVASLLVPAHHRMAGWVKEKLARQPSPPQAADEEQAEVEPA